MPLIRNQKDFYAGLLFMVFGLAALVISRSYPVGTAARMGPGYFPHLLGFLLLGMGAILSLRGLRSIGPAPSPWHWQPLAIVLTSVALFSLVAQWLGLILTGLVLVLISSMASEKFRWKEALISGAIQGVFAVAVFVYGLKMPLPVWPVFLVGGL